MSPLTALAELSRSDPIIPFSSVQHCRGMGASTTGNVDTERDLSLLYIGSGETARCRCARCFGGRPSRAPLAPNFIGRGFLCFVTGGATRSRARSGSGSGNFRFLATAVGGRVASLSDEESEESEETDDPRETGCA
jgi:hypothetical protein